MLPVSDAGTPTPIRGLPTVTRDPGVELLTQNDVNCGYPRTAASEVSSTRYLPTISPAGSGDSMDEDEVEGGTGSHVEGFHAPTSRCDGVQLAPWSSQDLETREAETQEAEALEAERRDAERREASKRLAKEELTDRVTDTILADLLREVLGEARSRVSGGPDQGADGADGAGGEEGSDAVEMVERMKTTGRGAEGEAGGAKASVPPSSGVGYGVLIAAEEGRAGGTEVQEIPEVGAVGCQVQTCSLSHALTLMLTLALVLAHDVESKHVECCR